MQAPSQAAAIGLNITADNSKEHLAVIAGRVSLNHLVQGLVVHPQEGLLDLNKIHLWERGVRREEEGEGEGGGTFWCLYNICVWNLHTYKKLRNIAS